MPGQTEPAFSLTTTFAPQQPAQPRRVHGGRRRPGAATTARSGCCSCQEHAPCPGPGQVQNSFESDPTISSAAHAAAQRRAPTVDYGNLLSLPVGGGLLYVEPVYVRASAGSPRTRCCRRCWCPSATRSRSGTPSTEALDRGVRRRAPATTSHRRTAADPRHRQRRHGRTRRCSRRLDRRGSRRSPTCDAALKAGRLRGLRRGPEGAGRRRRRCAARRGGTPTSVADARRRPRRRRGAARPA